MPRKRPYARIAITLPPEVLAAADRLARELDRSRSWVVAEAIRQIVARGVEATRSDRVRETGAVYQAGAGTGLGESRTTQLRADLQLTPEARVRAAEETARLGWLLQPRTRGQRIIAFDQPEDYLRWKQRDAAGA
jgi:predicted transcriptional regulator